MAKSNWFIILAFTIFSLVILLDLFDFELLSSTLELSLVPVIALIYTVTGKNISKDLLVFFILYSIGDIINILDFDSASNWSYYTCNLIYILAYFFLVLYITNSLNFKLIFKRFFFEFLVLLLLDAYMVYVLIDIVKPINFESNFVSIVQLIELFYSLVLIAVLSLSFLNYIQNQVKKHLLLFVSCLLIAFSELILIGYYYIMDDIKLSYASTILYVSGILILYFHSFVDNQTKM